VRESVEARGGKVSFVALTVSENEEERRLSEPGRAAFGKLRSVELLRELRESFLACAAVMPAADATIDTQSDKAERGRADHNCVPIGIMALPQIISTSRHDAQLYRVRKHRN
jgi:hypothetical protein